MSNLNDFTGILTAGGSNVQNLGQVSGNVQLDVSQYNTFTVEPIGATTFTLTGLGNGSIRKAANLVLFDGGTTNFTWDSRIVFSSSFDGFFSQSKTNQKVDILQLVQTADDTVVASVDHTETTGS